MGRGERDANSTGSFEVYAEAVRSSPSGLMVYQFTPPDRFFLLEANPSAEMIFKKGFEKLKGREFEEVWSIEYCQIVKGQYLEVMRTGKSITLQDVLFEQEGVDRVFNIRAYRMPLNKLGVSIEDITECWQEVEEKSRAYDQIEKNIEHFATLVDEIRNPAFVIRELASKCPQESSRKIILQAERIENIIMRLEQGWLDSETVRDFLSKPRF